MNKEVWVNIPNYEKYMISTHGRIKNQKGNAVKQYKNDKGYLYVSLSKNNIRKFIRVHKLVAELFLDKNNFKSLTYENKEEVDFDKLEVNHKDENKENNCVENLEWCTRLYNMNYGNVIEKVKKSHFKKVNQYKQNGEFLKTWNSLKEIKEKYNNIHLWEALNGKRKSACGYIWKYYDKT